MAYLHRTIKDKPDVDSILDKEEPIGVGMEWEREDYPKNNGVIPKIVFMYDHFDTVIYYRTMTATEITVGFTVPGDVDNIAIDPLTSNGWFTTNTTSGAYTGSSLYRFTYDPDTGVPSAASLVYTSIHGGRMIALFCDRINQRIYLNGGSVSTGVGYVEYDGSGYTQVTNSFGNPRALWMSQDPADTIMYGGDTGVGFIFSFDTAATPPATVSTLFKEDSSVFGASTWYEWSQIDVDELLGVAILGPGGGSGAFSTWTPTAIRYTTWPTFPATPTSWPPAYSTKFSESNSGGMAYAYDPVGQHIYIYRNSDFCIWRYDFSNKLLQNESLIVNLTASAFAPLNKVSILRLG